MKRKLLQYIAIQDPIVTQFSDLRDCNDASLSMLETPIQKQKASKYEYLGIKTNSDSQEIAFLEISKIPHILFGFASNLVESFDAGYLIINFGTLKYLKNKNQKQSAFDIPKIDTDLHFSEFPPLTSAKMYFVLYPHIHNLKANTKKIQFKVFGKNDSVGIETFLAMQYTPPTQIKSPVEIGFKYPESVLMFFNIPQYEYKYTDYYFSTKVLSNGVYISEEMISTALWKNILYPKDVSGTRTALKNWWRPIADLDPKSENYNKFSIWYNSVVGASFREEAVYGDLIKSFHDWEDSSNWDLNPYDNEPFQVYESITKIFHFCNLLSLKCGLTPYYEFIDISEDGLGEPQLSTKTWPKQIRLNSKANGFRLPTKIEMKEFLIQQFHQNNALWYISNNDYYQITQDIYIENSLHIVDPSHYIFESFTTADVSKNPKATTFQFDQDKLDRKIKKISDTNTYQKLVSRKEILIDPKTYPTDQNLNYNVFTDCGIFSMRLDYFDEETKHNPIQFENQPYAAWQVLGDFGENHKFGFRVVKNK